MLELCAVTMDEHSENESDSSSSEAASENATERDKFYYASSARDPSGLPPSKRDRSLGNSSSDEEEDGEGEKHSDSSSTSSEASNAENVAKRKSLVTFSTTATSAVDKSTLMGGSLVPRCSSLRSSSSVGGEGESPQHDSDDEEFGAVLTRKRQASDASSNSPPPAQRTAHTVEYSDFARRMMVSHLPCMSE